MLQKVLEELLHDRYMQQQMACISILTTDTQLRDVLPLASLKEYCLRPVGNQPLLVYRFVKNPFSNSCGECQVPKNNIKVNFSPEFINPSYC